jgi:hypothetical protein
MKKLNLLTPALIAMLPRRMIAQNEFYNNGASVYVQLATRCALADA